MKHLLVSLTFLIACFPLQLSAQDWTPDREKLREDLKEILTDLEYSYVYFEEKGIDLACLREYYGAQIDSVETEEDVVLLFEYLLDEFTDSHVMLNTNRASSYRLFAPLYATLTEGRLFIFSLWQTQLEQVPSGLIGAQLISWNGIPIEEAIAAFPTHCNDKDEPKVREWIANKILAGRYNQPRMLKVQLNGGQVAELDLDQLQIRSEERLLSHRVEQEIGIIRIHNSLGNNDLIRAFDSALDQLTETKGLIIDLRNTIDGGNSYVARGIMSRFITEARPYQQHLASKQFGDNPPVPRRWVEYVQPRGETYPHPVIVLVGRWTGSMGEGLAIGFEGMQRGKVMGTEMERLAGEMNGFGFRHQSFGYRLSVARLFHLNGTPREAYLPSLYVPSTTTEGDETMERALEWLRK
ncbi:MAG: S41 family peptidase [Bacteroidota bacterium]